MLLIMTLVTRVSFRLHSRHQVNPVSIAMLFAAVKPGFNCGMCPALKEAFAPDEATLTPKSLKQSSHVALSMLVLLSCCSSVGLLD